LRSFDFRLETQISNGVHQSVKRERLVPAGLLALLLWIVASLPGEDLQSIQAAPESPLLRTVLSDPFMHALTFALLAMLIAWSFRTQPEHAPSGAGVPFARIAALTIGYGFCIEIYQAILPWRSFGFDDLCWNTIGVLLCLALLKWQPGRARRSTHALWDTSKHKTE
jgi:hypothetical protein